MKIRIILHGQKAQLDALREAIDTLRQQHDIEVRVTYESGDVARLVNEALKEKCSRLVAAGGDGTVNQVVDAIMSHPKSARPEVAILPLGTANDFATACTIPHSPIDALTLALEGSCYWVDVIQANETHMINVASGGFGAKVTSTTPPALKNFLGGGAYTLSGLIQAFDFKPYDGEFIIDGKTVSEQLLVGAVCNSRLAGGGQLLGPNAYINDGLMDVLTVHQFPLEALPQVLQELREPSADNQFAEFQQKTNAHWHAHTAMPINLDGEPLSVTDMKFDLVKHAIKMVLPADCPTLLPQTVPISKS